MPHLSRHRSISGALSGARRAAGTALLCSLPLAAAATQPASASKAPATAAACQECEEWNRTQQPFRIYGGSYYVGVHGLSAILITGDRGHILIDGDLEESAPKIAASIAALGFKVQDVELLLNSHVHYDHAGGLAVLQHLSGAHVAASAPAAAVLSSGHLGKDDPQHDSLRTIAPLADISILNDGAKVHAGQIAVQAHLTPGHTPGGTTWTWRECEDGRCVHMVYADSLTPVSSPGYLFSKHPEVLAGFEKSFRILEKLPCDVLITPHPDASDLWSRLAKNQHGGGDAAFIDSTACRRYAQRARVALKKRLEEESHR